VETNFYTCLADRLQSAEDRFISRCMREAGVILADTAESDGRQRFIGISASEIATTNPWETRSWMTGMYELWNKEGHGRRWGRNVTSTYLVSFHKIHGVQKMKRLHAILYDLYPRGSTLGDYLAFNITQKGPLIDGKRPNIKCSGHYTFDFTTTFRLAWRAAALIFILNAGGIRGGGSEEYG